jgi:hypothetical protein
MLPNKKGKEISFDLDQFDIKNICVVILILTLKKSQAKKGFDFLFNCGFYYFEFEGMSRKKEIVSIRKFEFSDRSTLSTLNKGPHPGTEWKHLNFRLKLSPETLFHSVDFIDLNRSLAKPSGRVSGHR